MTGLIGPELGNTTGFFANHPGRRQGHAPAALRAYHLVAIQVGISTPATLVVLNAPGGDLPVYSFINFLLCLAHLLSNLWSTTNNMQRCPSQQSRYWIEVRAISLAAYTRRLEWYAAAATEGIPHPGNMTKLPLAQLLHQLGQAYAQWSPSER